MSTSGSARSACVRLAICSGDRNAASGRTTSACGSGLLLERVERSAETRAPAELLERVVGLDQRHLVHVPPLTELGCNPARILEGRRLLHVHRDVERIAPAATRRADVLHQHVQAGRQRQRDADHEDRKQRGEGLLPEPAQRADQRLRVALEPLPHVNSPAWMAASGAGSPPATRPPSSITRRTP